MTVGGLLAAASFVVAFFVELALEKTLPIYPTDGNGQINLINNLPCQLNITNNLKQEPIFLNSGDMYRDMDVKAGEVEYTFQTWGCSLTNSSATYHHSLKNLAIDNIFIYENRSALEFLTRPDSLDKPKNAETNVRIFYNLPVAFDPNSTFTLTNTENKVFNLLFHATDTAGFTNYTLVPPDVYSLSLPDTNNSVITLETKSGGCYIVQIMGNNTHDKAFVYTMVEPNTLSLLVQIPQYIVITFGEIMFSITGLEFSYSQAPPSMKSVLQAAWLMTVAFGNLIVVIVASAGHMKQSYEFIMFAGLMAVDMIIFAIMAYFYKSIIKPNNEEADTLPEKKGSYALNSASSKGKENGAYTNDANSNM